MKRKSCKAKPGRSTERPTKKIQKSESTNASKAKRKYTKKSLASTDKGLGNPPIPDAAITEWDPTTKWIIVELTEDTSLEANYEQIERILRDVLGPDVEYFLPLYNEKVQGKNACFVHFDGYIFVRRTDEVIKNIHKLHAEHIKGALFIDGCLRLVSGVRINKFKKDMQEKIHSMIPEKGQRVIPKIGVFKNLEGVVLSVDKKKLIALVRFEKPSRIVDAPINIVNLTIISR